jgi:hypothetical protein
MRNGLLSDLAVVGYEILLEGNNIKLRYRKPYEPPETVRPLIDELRTYKAEVINILKTGSSITPTETTQPGVNVKAVWPPEMREIINWFEKLETPSEPFDLEPHQHVIDPVKYFSSLRQEIAIGPRCPRGRKGALLYDLNTLRKNLH